MSFLKNAIKRVLMPNWGRNYIILKQLDLAYGRVLKAANSSIKLSLHDLIAGEQRAVRGVNRDEFWQDFPHGRADLLTAAELVSRHPDAFIFTFTRNPFSRVASTYYDKLVFKGTLPTFYRRRGFAPDMGFSEFVERIVTFDDESTDKHLCSQTYVLGHQGRILPQFIGRVETIAEDWQRLSEAIVARGGPQLGRLRSIHKTVHKRPPTAELFSDPGLVRLVIERYRGDFETFYPDIDTPIDDAAAVRLSSRKMSRQSRNA